MTEEVSIESLQRELWGVQEMLGHVLLSVGEPVVVTKEALARSLPDNARIVIDDNIETETFTFYVEVME